MRLIGCSLAALMVIAVETSAAAEEPAPSPQASARGQTSFGGRAVRRGSFTADLGFGYPYLFDLRLTLGIAPALDGGVEVRTFGQFTDIAAHAKLQLVDLDPVFVGLVGALGGGGGPDGRNTFFGDVGLAVTLAFGDLVSFSARGWLDAWTDRFCPSRDDTRATPRQGCTRMVLRENGSLYDPRGGRDAGARFYLGAWLDVAVGAHLSAFVGLYGAPFQDQRLMFKDALNDIFLTDDQKVYGQIGLGVKY